MTTHVLFVEGVPKVIYDGVTPKGVAAFASTASPRGINRKGATAMQNYYFNVSGKVRKQLVEAISEILETEAIYQKAPTYSYLIGDIVVDKEGTATGEFSPEFLTALAERGFVPESDAPKATTEEEVETSEDPPAPEAQTPENPPEPGMFTDSISIDIPLDGFSPEAIDNLCKLVLAKEALIKMAIGAESLPIRVLTDRISFDWFKISDSENMMEYAKFITALCDTAKRKKRVTARAQGDFENPRFSMRTWLTALGMAGAGYSQIRRLLTTNLPGNGAYRYGKPDNGIIPKKRKHIHREVISIRLTPDTIEKLNAIAAKTEAETGQRISKNMLIEQAAEAYVAAQIAGDAPGNEAAEDILEL